MNITIYCIGSLKERYWKEAVEEYRKRLLGYVKLSIEEFPDCPCPENCSPAQMEAIKEKEGEKILKKLGKNEYLIALDIPGKTYDSVALAHHIDRLLVENGSSISFLIGGSLGIGKSLLDRCNESISLGPNTFPHQLVRVMLLEVIYRSFRIIRGEPYHK